MAVYFDLVEAGRPAENALLLPTHACHDALGVVNVSALQFQRRFVLQTHAADVGEV